MEINMKIVRIAGAYLLTVSIFAAMLHAAKPTDYSTDMVMLSDGQVMQTLKLYVSGQKSRVEGITAGPLGSVISIHRRDKELTWVLYPSQREYTEKALSVSQNAGKPDLSSLDLGTLKKENLGKETVLGYACTKMRVTMGNMPNGRPMTATVWAADSLDLPIRLDVMGIVQENRNLKIGPQPASLFEIPAGYRKTQSPGSGLQRGAFSGMQSMESDSSAALEQNQPNGSEDNQALSSVTSKIQQKVDKLKKISDASEEATPAKLADRGRAAAKEGLQKAAQSGKQSMGVDASAVPAKKPSYGGKEGQAYAGVNSTIQLEADKLKILRRTSGEATPARFADDGYATPGAFTGDRTLHWRNARDIGAILELGISASKKGRYGLLLHLGKYRTFGRFQFLINGNPVGKPVDFFGFPEKDEIVEFSIDLGEVTLNQGENRLGLKLVGTNPETVMADYGACIDWVQLSFKGEMGPTGGSVSTTGDSTDIHPDATTITGTAGGSAGAPAILEADTLEILQCTSGNTTVAKLAADGYANEGEFTGNRSLQWHDAGDPGALLELAIAVARTGAYAISVRAAKYRTYGIHQFLINGKPLGKPVDMFGNPGQDIVTAFTVNLGEALLNSGNNRLGIRFFGTNPNTIMENHGAGLDWIKLTPVRPKP
jgi:hypothetical protein